MKQLLVVLFFFPIAVWSQTNFEKAQQLMTSGKTEQARLLFEIFLKETPNHLRTIEYLGDIAGQNKLWDSAISYYKTLKQLKPTEANYYYKYGGALGMKAKESNKFKALGMIGEIKSSFEKAIVLDPKHKESRWALITLYLQLPGIVGGSETKAVAYSNELMQLSPLDGYWSKAYIEAHFGRTKNAELNYIKAFELSRSKAAFQKLYDFYLHKMKDTNKALQLKQQFEK